MAPPGSDQVAVTGVTLSSRTVRPGDLYAALPGARVHGADFVGQASRAGAVAVLTDRTGAARIGRCGLPVLVTEDPRGALGGIAAQVYGLPARQLLMLGVTGTNGKTTTSYLLDAVLRAVGHTTGLIGTVEIRVGQERVRSTGTTPEASDLHALLAVMLEHGADACAMEVSSHALDQHRVNGVVFDVAGFTNLSQDHLDYHHSMAEYFAVKAQLFTPQRSRRAVICVDDEWGRQLARRSTVPVQTVSARACSATTASVADWQVTDHVLVDGHSRVEVSGPDGIRVGLRSPLPGDFNLANSLVALAMLVAVGVPVVTATTAIGDGPVVPGRMERIAGNGADDEPLVVVDYAHSPDAVRGALAALQGSGRPVVVVLGAGGERDRGKRSLMGVAAADAADVVIVTDDNPRSEDPATIRAALLDGARGGSGRQRVEATVLEIADRRAAVVEGVRRAWGGGVLLVAGKGHELGQEIAGQVFPFDDREAARQALRVVAAGVGVPAGTGTDVEGTRT